MGPSYETAKMIQYYSIRNQASIYGETTSTDKVKLLRAAWFSWNEEGSRLDCRPQCSGTASLCNRIAQLCSWGRSVPFLIYK